jgi:hypothetical protein
MARSLRCRVLDAILALFMSAEFTRIDSHCLLLRVLNFEGDSGMRPPAAPCLAGADLEMIACDGSSMSIESSSCLSSRGLRLRKGFSFSSLKISARAWRLARERFGFESGRGELACLWGCLEYDLTEVGAISRSFPKDRRRHVEVVVLSCQRS